MEESGEPSEIDECSEPPKKKVARKKVIVYFMLSLFLDVTSNRIRTNVLYHERNVNLSETEVRIQHAYVLSDCNIIICFIFAENYIDGA